MTAMADPGNSGKTLNFNVGVLGHVDSGKTSLAKALSSTASTAAFDKNPQSKERGITLDLGFSSFTVDLPEHLKEDCGVRGYSSLQFTLVDCPGHASLIRTIIGGAQIIDLMLLVVDVVKGLQTQTAECLLIGELTCPRMVVILNKIDLLPSTKRQAAIDKMSKRMHKTLENTSITCLPLPILDPPWPPSPKLLKAQTYLPRRDSSGPLLMAVDHCFSIRGQGTVMTGTILQGALALNDTVEIPSLKVTRKVKSVQMFRQPVGSAMQGDRVGVCVTQFDPKLLERGMVCTPGSLRTLHAGLISVRKIGYFRGALTTRSKFHITVGHETVMAKVSFFGLPTPTSLSSAAANDNQSLLQAPADASPTETNSACPLSKSSPLDKTFCFDREYIYQEEYVNGQSGTGEGPNPEQWALLEFERPVTCPSFCLVIGSKLDTDIHANACRLAFQGRLLEGFEDKGYTESTLPRLKVYKTKQREGQVERGLCSLCVHACGSWSVREAWRGMRALGEMVHHDTRVAPDASPPARPACLSDTGAVWSHLADAGITYTSPPP
ncbi:hypothetical protein JZ751_014736 [Albula glossodonta]|uniref:Selenocysteine-specific elongation factor n=1 Tax=Albula glossodonta TaxID=121402 RepID=A0A8T2N480_9TELE|nr:hypothetical protein JZ751_014736 [Albula glossodonta]